MKAITILQPWASLVAIGAKKIETRSWATKYRGPLAIHAGASDKGLKLILDDKNACSKLPPAMYLVYGCVIAIVELVDCVVMTPEWIEGVPEPERSFGWYESGRVAWLLANVRQIDPVPAKGFQRIWEWEG
jgi:hypothetical protein